MNSRTKTNSSVFFSKLYRNEDCFFWHDAPSQKKVHPGLLYLWMVFLIFIAFLSIGMASESETLIAGMLAAIGFFLVYPLTWIGFLCVYLWLWSTHGEQTFWIDRHHIRFDWWLSIQKGSRKFSRNPDLTISLANGGDFRAKAILIKNGRKKRKLSFASEEEANWVLSELQKFLDEVPMESTEIDGAALKAKITDPDSGKLIQETLDFQEKPLERVIPLIEQNEKTNLPESGFEPILVRCGKCHAVVPRNHILPDPAVGQCPTCGELFDIPELLRESKPCKGRVTVERDNESLLISQKPNRGFVSISVFVTPFIFALIMGIIFYTVWDYGPEQMLTPEIRHILITSTLILIPCLVLPLWGFFDRRTVFLDRETCRFTTKWLFLTWERTIPRSQLIRAKMYLILLTDLYHLFSFHYSPKRCFFIKTASLEELVWLQNEVNHFLYTIPANPFDPENRNPEVFGGIMGHGAKVEAYCPKCGHLFDHTEINLAEENTTCPQCQKTFPVAEMTWIHTGDVQLTDDAEGFEIIQTEDKLAIRFQWEPTRWEKIGQFGGVAFLYLVPLFLFLMFSWMHYFENGTVNYLGGFLMTAIMFPLYFPLLWIGNHWRIAQISWWEIRVDCNGLKLDLHYKKSIKTIHMTREEVFAISEGSQRPTTFTRQPFSCDKLPHKYYASNLKKQEEYRIWLIVQLKRFIAKHPKIEK